METLAGSLSVALENARLVHETRQRNAELALINSVQEALAGELEMQAIYDVVGDKIQEIFDAQVVDIGMLDFAAGLTPYPYTIERGVRFPDEPTPIERSLSTRQLIETKAPLLDQRRPRLERGARRVVSVSRVSPRCRCSLPPWFGRRGPRPDLVAEPRPDERVLRERRPPADDARRQPERGAGERAAGARDATAERGAGADQQRSGCDRGRARRQAIYDAVGDKIREIFEAQAVQINTLDEATGLMHFPYVIERGERLHARACASGRLYEALARDAEPLMITENVDGESERYGAVSRPVRRPKSVLFVPLVSGGKAMGTISLQNVDREHAFGESDQQLLETLAGGLSVALENARLVHETRQRNAELALINSVQEAIAGELDPQAIYDAVGDRIQEIFDAQTVIISTLDEATGLQYYPYIIERGQRLEEDEASAPIGFSKHVLETREPLLIVENLEAETERYGSRILAGGAAGEIDLCSSRLSRVAKQRARSRSKTSTVSRRLTKTTSGSSRRWAAV